MRRVRWQQVHRETRQMKRFPVSDNATPRLMIPWSLAEEAYAAYSRRYGTDQSLERIAERGGFSYSEMDKFRRGWQNIVNAEREQLESALITAIERATVAERERDAVVLEKRQWVGERDSWRARVVDAEYVTRECVKMLDLMNEYLRDQRRVGGADLRDGYLRVKALADPKGSVVTMMEVEELKTQLVARDVEIGRLQAAHTAIMKRHDDGKCTCGGCVIARAALHPLLERQ